MASPGLLFLKCQIIHQRIAIYMTNNTHKQPPKLLSVIIPVYNTEQYLAECIDSVIAQSEGISIEVHLVNDQSPDGSQLIIDEYVKKYPFIHGHIQSHGRQGKARNNGLKSAQGKYVFFLDSDDKLTAGALKHFLEKIECHQSDFVVGIARSFKGMRRWINSNHRAYKKEIINTDVEKTPQLISDTSSCNKLYRRAFLLENDIWFPEGTFCEDVQFIFSAYLLSNRITILPRIIHEYRGRKGGGTPSGTQIFSDKRVIQCTLVFRKSLEQYRDLSSTVVAEHLAKKIIITTCQQFRRLPGFPDSTSLLYVEIQSTLMLVSTRQIADNAAHYTIPLLMISKGYFSHAAAILNYGAITPVVEDFFSQLGKSDPESLSDILKINVLNKIHILDRVISRGAKKNLVFVFKRILRRIRDDFALLKIDVGQLVIFILKTLRGKHNISKNPKLKNKIKTVFYQRIKGVLYRCCFLVLRPFVFRLCDKRVWLIGEREGKGMAESSYVFFRYCTEERNTDHVYYVLDKKIPLPETIRRPECVIRKGSLNYFIHLLKAECFIFTNNELDVSPFLPAGLAGKGVKTVFFNHGVTYYNPGVYLRNIAHRFNMIIAVSEREKKQKIEDWSLKDVDKVKVTGFPIFDPLVSFSSRREVLFCPTWRNQLDDLSEVEFQESRYFKEIVSFLHDKKLHNYLKENQLELILRGHFRMTDLLHAFADDLQGSIQIEQHDSNRSLQNAMKDAVILITDYSSIMWDMAFMKKPVVLFQFDREAFLAERGLHRFSIPDAAMKFASFADNKDELMTTLTNIARSGFVLSPEQKKNISTFFKYIDNSNSKRVYREIESLFQ